MDAIVLRADLDKELSEADKVAGGALITSLFLKKTHLAMVKRGHTIVFISQNRAEIKGQYDKFVAKQGSSSGGNALQHYPDLVLEFLPRFNVDLITVGAKETAKIIGHWCKVKIWKCNNENQNLQVAYPIRYRQPAGKSVWVAKELTDLLLQYELMTKSASWIKFSDGLFEELCSKFGEERIPKMIQGFDAVSDFFDAANNNDILDYLYSKMLTLLA